MTLGVYKLEIVLWSVFELSRWHRYADFTSMFRAWDCFSGDDRCGDVVQKDEGTSPRKTRRVLADTFGVGRDRMAGIGGIVYSI